MRESAAKEKTHLPQDTFEEWVKSQKEKAAAKGRGREVAGNSFEAWIGKKVESRAKKTAGRGRARKTAV